METRTFRVEGLVAQPDAQQVQTALNEVWGIRSVDEVSMVRGEVTFTYDERAASLGDFHQALLNCGYEVIGGEPHGQRM